MSAHSAPFIFHYLPLVHFSSSSLVFYCSAFCFLHFSDAADPHFMTYGPSMSVQVTLINSITDCNYPNRSSEAAPAVILKMGVAFSQILSTASQLSPPSSSAF